jgi:anti-sigma B factor antagonist
MAFGGAKAAVFRRYPVGIEGHRDPANDATDDVLKISSRRDGDSAVVTLAGELDLDGACRLDVELGRLLDDGVRHLQIDAADLEFVDSSGLRSLVLARTHYEDAGGQFRISAVSPPVGRVIEIAGLTGVLLP